MKDYVIITESTIDCNPELVEEIGVSVIPFAFSMEDKEYLNYPDEREMSSADFYRFLREGEMSHTTQPNAERYMELMVPYLKEGKDIIVFSLSSAISGAYNSCNIAVRSLMEEYPDSKIIVIDSLCASMGQGLLCYLAAKRKAEGFSIEALADWVTEFRFKLCHWFTIDDLQFLRRGGRLSSAEAAFGGLLNIKPVLHVDDEGRLVPVIKTRGRKKALNALVDKMAETGINIAEQTIFISHGDCLADAEYVADEVRKRFGVKDIRINVIGPVIGCHAGPGTVALFFVGDKR